MMPGYGGPGSRSRPTNTRCEPDKRTTECHNTVTLGGRGGPLEPAGPCRGEEINRRSLVLGLGSSRSGLRAIVKSRSSAMAWSLVGCPPSVPATLVDGLGALCGGNRLQVALPRMVRRHAFPTDLASESIFRSTTSSVIWPPSGSSS